MVAYATPNQMFANYDVRTIGDLCSDTGTRVVIPALLTDPNLINAINSASGIIDSALMAGGMYTPADLQSIIGSLVSSTNTDNTPYMLVNLCCEIAMYILLARRPAYDTKRMKDLQELIYGPTGTITKLKQGQNVLGLPGQLDAGLPSVDGPTTLEYNNLNLMRDRCKNYYPPRVLPYNR
jgi:phage gp36-like protein